MTAKELIDGVLLAQGFSLDQLGERIGYEVRTLKRVQSGEVPLSEKLRRRLENLANESSMFGKVGDLREALEKMIGEAGITPEEAAARAKIPWAEMQDVLAGKKPVERRVLYRVQRSLANTSDILQPAAPRVFDAIRYDEKRENRVRHIPLLGWAQAGHVIDFEEVRDWENFVTTEIDDPKAIAVCIRGDSMSPRFNEGDIAVLSCSSKPVNEKFVIARLKDEGVVFKKFQIVDPDKRLFRLISLNPLYAPIERREEQFLWIYPVRQVIQQLE